MQINLIPIKATKTTYLTTARPSQIISGIAPRKEINIAKVSMETDLDQL